MRVPAGATDPEWKSYWRDLENSSYVSSGWGPTRRLVFVMKSKVSPGSAASGRVQETVVVHGHAEH